jgi:hypothetical protein
LKRGDPDRDLDMEFTGSAESPVLNPALVIQGWGEHEATLMLDGAEIPRGKDFRYGFRRTLDGADLIVWIKCTAEKPVRLVLSAK